MNTSSCQREGDCAANEFAIVQTRFHFVSFRRRNDRSHQKPGSESRVVDSPARAVAPQKPRKSALHDHAMLLSKVPIMLRSAKREPFAARGINNWPFPDDCCE